MDVGDFQQFRFQIESDLKALDKLLLCIEQVNQPSIPKQVWEQCRLAVVEGFTNAVRHAQKNFSKEIKIEIEITIFPQSIEIRIWDYGPPFDLDAYIKTLDRKQNILTDGGQGVKIIHKIADHLSYFRTTYERNCLLIVKKFSPIQEKTNE